ncbi:MAG: DUF998 domain-containing protein [Candidatus Helarchaeota archaeon]|nr:DUF998 domain-containing protein [Candidatus Helarchaeota archaeon]
MSIKETIIELKERFYDKVTEFDFCKKCTMLVMLFYFPLLIIGVIVAYLGPENFIPLLPDYIFSHGSIRWDRYSIATHWISDLGSIRYTPAPYLYDLAAIIAGALTLPLSFYLENRFAPLDSSRMRIRLGSLAWFWSVIGNIGYIGVGIFSEDRSYFGLHGITSGMAFGGFTFGAMFFGLIIILYNDTEIPKPLGIYGIVGPLGTIIIFGIVGGPFWEWMLLFSIIAWIIPLGLIIIHKGGN